MPTKGGISPDPCTGVDAPIQTAVGHRVSSRASEAWHSPMKPRSAPGRIDHGCHDSTDVLPIVPHVSPSPPVSCLPVRSSFPSITAVGTQMLRGLSYSSSGRRRQRRVLDIAYRRREDYQVRAVTSASSSPGRTTAYPHGHLAQRWYTTCS